MFLALFLVLPLLPSFPALPHLDLEPLPAVLGCLGLLLSGLGRGLMLDNSPDDSDPRGVDFVMVFAHLFNLTFFLRVL